jgi:hypothetical protein
MPEFGLPPNYFVIVDDAARASKRWELTLADAGVCQQAPLSDPSECPWRAGRLSEERAVRKRTNVNFSG